MTTTPSPLITTIAAVLQKDYGLGPDSAPSIVRKVLEMSAAQYTGNNTEEREVVKNGTD